MVMGITAARTENPVSLAPRLWGRCHSARVLLLGGLETVAEEAAAMKSRIATVLSLLAFAGCADELGSSSAESHARLSGAIFTTTSDGTRVNANNYDAKCDVYLNGGPAPDGSAGLPEGDYYFQVTDPSGATLLSSDDVTMRQVSIDASGRFTGVSGAGNHATSSNEIDGGATVQLCPFDDTPNNGCVYKVWLTPVEDYDLAGADRTHGFFPQFSKTDNFRVCEDDVETPPDAGVPPPPPDAGVPPMPPDAGHDCPDAGMEDSCPGKSCPHAHGHD